MASHQYLVNICVIFLWIIFLSLILSCCCRAYALNATYPTPYDLYSDVMEPGKAKELRRWLIANGHVYEDVDPDDVDRIITATYQACTFYPDISPSLILAMISTESGFRTNVRSGNARGLMQLIPSYHYLRMETFVESTTDLTDELFYDMYLNIMCGADYINYILTETKGDLNFALMWYNQGAVSASRDYEANGRVSKYAKNVIALMEQIDEILNT